jgi:hypothetical protein
VVSAVDLTRASDRLQATRGVAAATAADTAALASTVAGRVDATGWWVGPQGDDLRSGLRQLADDARTATGAWESLADSVQGLQATAAALAGELAALERQRAAAQDTLARLWRTARGVVEDTFGVDAGVAEEQAAIARIEHAIVEVGRRWAVACQVAAPALDAGLAAVSALGGTDATIRLGGLVLPTGAALDLLVGLLDGAPRPDADPDQVAAWWGSLTAAEHDAWIAAAPQLVGNLDGIPFRVRAGANRITMQALVDSLPAGDPLLARLQQFLTAGGRVDPDRHFIVFDPGGDGRVAELLGDLDAAEHVAVLVPGMGSTMANFTHGVRSDAEALYRATPGSAVVAWTGYDAPAGIETGRLWEVTSSDQAIAGGAALVTFLGAVRAQTSGSTTLIGHSYGSHAAGQALLQGARVDRAVFIGSPGVGVDHVSEFPSGAAREYFAGEVDGDPVATLERFGEAPTSPDFGAFAYDAGPPDSLSPLARHSEYFDRGTARDNLATIVSGGTPTPDRPRLIERGLELREDVQDRVHQAVDRVQDATRVPVVGPIVHDGIDTVQRVDRAAGQVVDVVGEAAGHYATELGGWMWDRGGDLVSGAGDAIGSGVDKLTFWR